jgi:signal transduction histidine kinase
MMAMTDATSPTWRRRLGNIRVRVVVGYVALLAAALAISALVTRQVLLARLDSEIDRALVQEVEELRLLADGTDPETGEPFGTDVQAIIDTFLGRSVPADNEAFYTLLDGEPYLRDSQAPAELLDDDALIAQWATAEQPLRASAETALGEVEFLVAPLLVDGVAAGTFVVLHFPEPDRDDILQVLRVVLVAGVVVLIASAALAWSLAGRVLRPVRDLTTTAREITDTDLSARIPVVGDDELGELGRTFNQMLDRLEQGFAMQRGFLDDVAHELRTPITIVQGHLELLSDDPADRDETVAVITDELDRMSRYVSDLLLLAKAEQPDFLRPQPIDIGEFAADLMQRFVGLGDRSWVLDEAPAPGRLAIVADPGRLSQALLNLAANAVQHTGPGDEIGFGVDTHPGPIDTTSPVVRMWVRDSGPGIEPSVRAALFQRHSRGASSREGRPDGMGIGLSIVDAIARGHAGHVDVESEPGAGARFVITLPIGPESALDDEADVDPLDRRPDSHPEPEPEPDHQTEHRTAHQTEHIT